MNQYKINLLIQKMLIILCVLLITLLYSCEGKLFSRFIIKNKSAILEQEPVSTGIKTLVSNIEERQIIPNIHSFGTISVRKSIEVTTTVEGVVERIFVEESDKVRKNQTLLRLRDIQLEISQKKAQTNVETAEADLLLKVTEYEESRIQIEAKFIALAQQQQQLAQQERELEDFELKYIQQQELFKINGVSKEEISNLRLQQQKINTEYNVALLGYESAQIGYRDIDLQRNNIPIPTSPEEKKEQLILLNTRSKLAQITFAEARLAVAQADLDSINLLITELTLKSPVSGTIINKSKEVGERTKKDEVLFTIIDESDIDIIFSVPDSVYKSIKFVKHIQVKVPTLDKTFSGDMRFISPVVDPQSGTITIKAKIVDSTAELKHGMYAEVDIITGNEYTALFIPSQSLISRKKDKANIFKVVNDRLVTVSITLGQEDGEFVEVIDGLDASDIIVYKILPSLQEGTLIEAIYYN